MKKFKHLLILLIFTVSLLGSTSVVSAQSDIFCNKRDPKTNKCIEDPCSLGDAKNSPACQQISQQEKNKNDNPISGPRGIIQAAANIFALVAAVGGTILILYGAFVFTTAGGVRSGDNSNRARQGRTIITSALTGMVIVAFAWLIITFVNTRIIQ